MIGLLLRAVDRVAMGEYCASARDLAVARIIVAGYLLLSLPAGRWLTALPAAFYSPRLSFAVLLDDFASPAIMVAVNLAATAAALTLLIGYRTRISSLATTAAMVALQTMIFATGKIDHNILVVLAPAVMAWSGWGDTWSVDALLGRVRNLEPDNVAPRWHLAWMALIIALAMATAGLVKARTGWLSLEVTSSYGHAMANAIVTGRRTAVGDLMLSMPSRLLWEPLDWATVVLESAGLAAWWRGRWFRTWCTALAAFHLGVALQMDIWFSTNLAAYALFVPWTNVLRRVGRRRLSYALVAIAAFGVTRTMLEWVPTTAPAAGVVADITRRAMVVLALPVAATVWLARRRGDEPNAADLVSRSAMPVEPHDRSIRTAP